MLDPKQDKPNPSGLLESANPAISANGFSSFQHYNYYYSLYHH